MNLLLDTHVFLWFSTADERLPISWRDAIRDETNQVFLSVVSEWEILIKFQLGKLPLPEPPEEYLPRERMRHEILTLPFEEACLQFLAKLPSIHRDPFDRALVAQALQHGCTLVTVDAAIWAYPVTVLK